MTSRLSSARRIGMIGQTSAPSGHKTSLAAYATVARRLESLGFDVERPPRNPPWAEEELILALDLYLRSGLLDDTNQAVS